MDYLVDIGLEVHAELATRSKMFCSCAVVDPLNAAPNSAVCPICAGMPGTLPVINKRAVELAARAALALECEVQAESIFARKNYFYPDLPKGYQISQYENPLAINGRLLIDTPQGTRAVRIRRAHLEEDTGKLSHAKDGKTAYSLVDLNRAGIPLVEIVSEPDLHSAEEALIYGQELRALLRWLGVSSGDMEKGAMRFEANLSLRPAGSSELGTRVEIKNLNSFRAMHDALQFEIERQTGVLESGKKVSQQTLGWNEAEGRTIAQRSKEEANDYRYFPEPDLPPLLVDAEWLSTMRAALPELPRAARERLMRELRLPLEDAARLTAERSVAEFFEAAVRAAPNVPARSLSNWLLGDVFSWLNQNGGSMESLPLRAADFARLVELVQQGAVNPNSARIALVEMLRSARGADEVIAALGLGQLSDTAQVAGWVAETLRANAVEVQAYLAGKETVVNWLFGQVMRTAGGRANPALVKQELQRQLDALKK